MPPRNQMESMPRCCCYVYTYMCPWSFRGNRLDSHSPQLIDKHAKVINFMGDRMFYCMQSSMEWRITAAISQGVRRLIAVMVSMRVCPLRTLPRSQSTGSKFHFNCVCGCAECTCVRPPHAAVIASKKNWPILNPHSWFNGWSTLISYRIRMPLHSIANSFGFLHFVVVRWVVCCSRCPSFMRRCSLWHFDPISCTLSLCATNLSAKHNIFQQNTAFLCKHTTNDGNLLVSFLVSIDVERSWIAVNNSPCANPCSKKGLCIYYYHFYWSAYVECSYFA